MFLFPEKSMEEMIPYLFIFLKLYYRNVFTGFNFLSEELISHKHFHGSLKYKNKNYE